MRSGSTPDAARLSFTDCARRSPRAWLYSVVPFSSQWPSISSTVSAFSFSHSASPARVSAASDRSAALSKSK